MCPPASCCTAIGAASGWAAAWTAGSTAPSCRAGRITLEDWAEVERGSARTVGTCNTMGTASTMTAIAETLGLCLTGASSVPAVDALQRRLASQAGRQAVELVWQDLKPSDILTPAAFQNAALANFALAGSTNAAIHILAMARRARVDLDLPALDALAKTQPVLADVMPSGRFLLEDFYEAGGLAGAAEPDPRPPEPGLPHRHRTHPR